MQLVSDFTAFDHHFIRFEMKLEFNRNSIFLNTGILRMQQRVKTRLLVTNQYNHGSTVFRRIPKSFELVFSIKIFVCETLPKVVPNHKKGNMSL